MRICYDEALTVDGSKGGLRILYPVSGGFVEYTFVHSVMPARNCDVWRMSVVNALDENGGFLYRLTKDGAEWEMAIRLADRPDFIGGYIHGDEIGTAPTILLDGKPAQLSDLTLWTEATTLQLRAESLGYDPAAPEKVVLKHYKQLTYAPDGVHLEQEVLWQEDITLDSSFKSFLAMMPPVKHDPQNPQVRITDSFAMNATTLQPITNLPVVKSGVQTFIVAGKESAYRFSMSVDGYTPRYPNTYLAMLSDNGSHLNYHKMYISFAGGALESIPAGTKWQASTHYQIKKEPV